MQRARRTAGSYYSALRRYARFLGLSDPIATFSAYADPFMQALRYPVNSREVLFGRAEVPRSLLNLYLPGFAHYEFLPIDGGNNPELGFIVDNYYGCRRRNGTELFLSHEAFIALTKVE